MPPRKRRAKPQAEALPDIAEEEDNASMPDAQAALMGPSTSAAVDPEAEIAAVLEECRKQSASIFSPEMNGQLLLLFCIAVT